MLNIKLIILERVLKLLSAKWGVQIAGMIFKTHAEKSDDNMCRLHYTGLKKSDIIFDKTGMVNEFMELCLTGDLWSDDVL